MSVKRAKGTRVSRACVSRECVKGTHNLTHISEDTKRLALSYAHWFNAKYQRSGHLFEGRFKSEAISSDEHLLAAVRYIMNNPVKVGLPISNWTSYNDYLHKVDDASMITEVAFVLEMFSPRLEEAQKLIKEFVTTTTTEEPSFIDEHLSNRLSDNRAIELIKEKAQVKSCDMISGMKQAERDSILSLLKQEGITIRQLARLTGINQGMIQRAKQANCVSSYAFP